MGRWICRDPIGELGHRSRRELASLTNWIVDNYYNLDEEKYLRANLFTRDDWLSPYTYVGNRPTIEIDPLGLYGKSVHIGWTDNLARWLGYPSCAIQQITSANQGIDDNPDTSPWAGVEARRLWHFPTPERVRYLIDKAYGSCKYDDLGKALHALQDSFSHAGFGPVMGHLLYGEAPDIIQNDPGKTQRMLNSTENVLKAFMDKCSKCGELSCDN